MKEEEKNKNKNRKKTWAVYMLYSSHLAYQIFSRNTLSLHQSSVHSFRNHHHHHHHHYYQHHHHHQQQQTAITQTKAAQIVKTASSTLKPWSLHYQYYRGEGTTNRNPSPLTLNRIQLCQFLRVQG